MSDKQYLTYDEYTDLGGKVDQAAYNRLETKARKTVDYYTSDRIRNDFETAEPESFTYYQSLKMLMVELIDTEILTDIANNKQVSSETNSGVSRSFVTYTDIQFANMKYRLIRTYLTGEVSGKGVSLLYMGV